MKISFEGQLKACSPHPSADPDFICSFTGIAAGEGQNKAHFRIAGAKEATKAAKAFKDAGRVKVTIETVKPSTD